MKKMLLLGVAGLGILAACKDLPGKKQTSEEAIKTAGKLPGINAGTGRFEIETPGGWVRMDTAMSGLQTTLLMSSDAGNGFRSNVNVITQAMAGLSGEKYFDENVAVMARDMENFRVIEKGQKEINGLPAHYVHYTTMNGGRALEQELFIIPSGDIAYLVTCTSLQGRMQKDKPNFDAAVNSFKVRQ